MVLPGETVITGGPVETEKSAAAAFDPPPIPPPSNPIYKPSSDERLTAATIPVAPVIDLGQIVQQAITPAVQQEVKAATTGITALATGLVQAVRDDLATANGRLDALEAQGASAVATAIPVAVPALSTELVNGVGGILNTAEHDVWLPRAFLGGLVGASLLILAFYLAGSHAAADIVAWLIPIFGSVVALVGRMLLATAAGPKPSNQGAAWK